MRDLLRVDLPDGRRAVIRHSTKADGDLSPSTVEAGDLDERRAALVPNGSWHATRQVHGRTVVEVTSDEPVEERPQADVLVTSGTHRVLAVHTGDCVPIGLVHPAGVVAAVHAGWRGLEAEVVGAAVQALERIAGAPGEVVAAIGPHVRAGKYEFGAEDLDRMVSRFGDTVVGRSEQGSRSLDLTEATRRALGELGVEVRSESPDCTAALASDYWSHRARGERGRIALTVWLEPA